MIFYNKGATPTVLLPYIYRNNSMYGAVNDIDSFNNSCRKRIKRVFNEDGSRK